MLNNSGPRIDPCGTPNKILHQTPKELFTPLFPIRQITEDIIE